MKIVTGTDVVIAAVVIFVLALVMLSGCASGYRGETIAERSEAQCDRLGGVWTAIGCVFTAPPVIIDGPVDGTMRFDCAQLNGTVDRWGSCSKTIMGDL